MFIAIFEGMEDNPYMQERAGYIRDVTKRVLAHLLGVSLPDPATIDEESIVIAHGLNSFRYSSIEQAICRSLCNKHWWSYKSLSYHGSYT